MKTTLLLLAAIAQLSYSQTVTVKHTYYTSTFDTAKHIPVAVKWWMTEAMVSCSNHQRRTNKFAPDPKLPACTNLNRDYAGSGYDRGHNMSAEDNACSETGMKESFFYSNMCPQTPKLNRGAWKRLETYCRRLAKQYDSVLVWCGSVVRSGHTIGPDRVAVPDYCWKILYIKHEHDTLAYVFPNTVTVSGGLAQFRVSVDSVEHLSRIKFRGTR